MVKSALQGTWAQLLKTCIYLHILTVSFLSLSFWYKIRMNAIFDIYKQVQKFDNFLSTAKRLCSL